MSNSHLIFDFNKQSNLENWLVVDDGVMGGRSDGNLYVNKKGQGVFEGDISLDNYGGFSSVRYNFEEMQLGDHSKIILKVKGDGKDYQFRIKERTQDYYSYIIPFSTNGAWEEIEIELKDMYPSFRGRRLNRVNFSGTSIEGITLLIGNKKEESFKLLIDNIALM